MKNLGLPKTKREPTKIFFPQLNHVFGPIDKVSKVQIQVKSRPKLQKYFKSKWDETLHESVQYFEPDQGPNMPLVGQIWPVDNHLRS